jgi:putative ABC transport system substrate-binding protein
MRRRDFITLFASAVAVSARAQQPERVRRVGALMPFDTRDATGQEFIAALRQGLNEAGWTEGRNLQIDARWIGGDIDRRSNHATELVRLSPDVIFACFSAQLTALSRETQAIPIVFVGASDPVGGGYVASYARPGGNITGFTFFEATM